MFWKILLYLVGIVTLAAIVAFIAFNIAGKNAGIYVGEFQPDLSQIEDGEYSGEYTALYERVSAKVSFRIKEGNLQYCRFEKLYGTIGYGAPETIKLQIDQQEDLNFDAISGATVTSNLAKAAIKNALEKGPVAHQ